MGSISRQSRAERFVAEFGKELEALALKDRGHVAVLDIDNDGCVRFSVELDGFTYLSPSAWFNPESPCDEDVIHELAGDLGLPETEESDELVRARLKKAELL